jgi:hypothetical protein
VNPQSFALQTLLIAAGLCAATVVSAAEPRNDKLPDWAPAPKPRVVEDRFRVEVNFLYAEPDTRVRVDSSLTQRGTLIDTEDDLGLENSEIIPQAELTLLPGERHLVRLSALTSRRSARKRVDRQIRFEDDVYQVNENVQSQLDLTLFGMSYGYRFIVQDRAELTATFGFQIASLEANAYVPSRMVREPEDGVAPIPLIGLEARYDLNDRWSLEGRFQALTANIKEVEGTIRDGRIATTFRMNPYLVFGLGYRTFSVDVDSQDEDTPGRVDLSIGGPLLFVRASM